MATVIQRGPLQWQARIRRKGFPVQSKTFELKTDAEKWARRVEREMDAGTWRDSSAATNTTLAEALDRYDREVTSAKKGAITERVRIECWKKRQLAKVPLASIRGADLAEHRDKRLAEGIAPSTVVKELALIGHLFNVARTDWGIAGLANPLDDVRKPKVTNARDRIFVADEEARLLAALDGGRKQKHAKDGTFAPGAANPWMRPLVSLAIETAMRRGELLSLEWCNVDLVDAVAHLPDTKNGSSRDVPLSSRAVNILKALSRTTGGSVFPLSENAVKLAFDRAVKRARRTYVTECTDAGVSPDPRTLIDLHFHDLRHIATTRIASRLANIMELSAVTGHKDLRMLKRYYHPRASDLAPKLG